MIRNVHFWCALKSGMRFFRVLADFRFFCFGLQLFFLTGCVQKYRRFSHFSFFMPLVSCFQLFLSLANLTPGLSAIQKFAVRACVYVVFRVLSSIVHISWSSTMSVSVIHFIQMHPHTLLVSYHAFVCTCTFTCTCTCTMYMYVAQMRNTSMFLTCTLSCLRLHSA